MAKAKVTSTQAGRAASSTLRSSPTASKSKPAAGSALSQRKAPAKVTSPKATSSWENIVSSVDVSKDEYFTVRGLKFRAVVGDYQFHKTGPDEVIILKKPEFLRQYAPIMTSAPTRNALEFGVFDLHSADVGAHFGVISRKVSGLSVVAALRRR